MVPEASTATQIFVDSTGRRKRLLSVAGFLVAFLAALYIGMVGTSVVRASDAALTVKVGALPTATSASASASAAVE
ncbi:hypothetical protein GCM10009828_070690 [Actinoplanes couchii]|uniref:Uncharacterized protein n=2 Tax=Actinoplanes couchii TaxID=403638 RepID=A0ABQ3X5Z3_9ACTN|nr:hypothetical protein Aco03nite_023380 [Actinoplanes couchii]